MSLHNSINGGIMSAGIAAIGAGRQARANRAARQAAYEDACVTDDLEQTLYSTVRKLTESRRNAARWKERAIRAEQALANYRS